MKQTTKMSRAVSQLEHIYTRLTPTFGNGSLPVPIITVQSRPGTFGHCTTSKVWRRKDEATYELNIAAEVLNYPLEHLIDTMLHEMVHLYCQENDIKEVSRGGNIITAPSRHCRDARPDLFQAGAVRLEYGPGDNLVKYALNKGWNEIRIGRNTPLLSWVPCCSSRRRQRSRKAPPARRENTLLYLAIAAGRRKASTSFWGIVL